MKTSFARIRIAGSLALRHGLKGAAAMAALAGATGCVHVAAQQRGTLAQPSMTADDTATGLEAHVRAVSEGATGGLGGGGGGCGCN
jgi:hypothetical protein